jgi:hypothetical protein
MGMIIHKTDTEEVRIAKREINEREMTKEHQRGAEKLPLGIPKRCKVDQPGDRERSVSYKLGTGGYPTGNGEVRIQYINGHNKKEYHMGFAGRARTQGEMNSGEGVSDTGISFY